MPSISKCPSGMKHFFPSSSPKYKFPRHFTFSSQAISRSVHPRRHDIKINMQCQLQNKIACLLLLFWFFPLGLSPPPQTHNLSPTPLRLSLQDAEAKLENCVSRGKMFLLKCCTLYRTLPSTHTHRIHIPVRKRSEKMGERETATDSKHQLSPPVMTAAVC